MSTSDPFVRRLSPSLLDDVSALLRHVASRISEARAKRGRTHPLSRLSWHQLADIGVTGADLARLTRLR